MATSYAPVIATTNPFPVDNEVGVELDDEVAQVVEEAPADCPECPEPETCTPLCDHVWIIKAGRLQFGGSEGSYFCTSNITLLEDDEGSAEYNFNEFLPPHTTDPFSIYVYPSMQKCGQRTRAVVTDGTAEWTVVSYLFDNTVFTLENHDGVRLHFDAGLTGGSHSGTVQMQIEALPIGSEDWSDFGPLITIHN